EQLLLDIGQALVADGIDERLHDPRVDQRAARGHLADGASELVALGNAVLQEVGEPRRALAEERHRVLRIVVLREHDYSGARVPLANLLRCIDALALEVRW